MAEGAGQGVRPVVLVIMDGWGDAPDGPGNAVALAETPTFDRLCATALRTELIPFGREVGLPEGQMGNSEVGHLNIGAGRIVYQTLTRIDLAIETGAFMENAVLVGAMREAKARGATLHLLGLIGPGGVHAQDLHLLALLRLAKAEGLDERRYPCLSRWARHAARVRARVHAASGRGNRADWRRQGGDRLRAVLRDGSRQAVGSRAEGVRRADPRRGRDGHSRRTKRSRAPMRPASPTNSSCPR